MVTCVCMVVGELEIWSQGKYTTHCLVCTRPELYVCGGERITYIHVHVHAHIHNSSVAVILCANRARVALMHC